jgi:hypothetical protein
MDMIRHDHVTTDNDSEFRRTMAIFDKSSVNRDCSQNLATRVSIEAEQVQGRLKPREQQPYARRFPFDLPLHSERCSWCPPQRISNSQSAEDSGRHSSRDSAR